MKVSFNQSDQTTVIGVFLPSIVVHLKRTYGEYTPVVECKGMANVAHHYVLIQSQCHSTGEYCDSEGMNTGSMRQEEREWQLLKCSSEVVCKTTADRDSCAVSKSQREW